MRVFIACLAHETNSFSPIPTRRSCFESAQYFRPQGNDETPPDDLVGYVDFVKIARERGHQPILSLGAIVQPSAPTRRADYESLRNEILDDLARAMPVDMVLLMMHGAMMAEGYDDCEGDMLTRVRALVGPDVPIGVELDLHCNMTSAMVENATILVACKEYPHTDFTPRARELYDLVERTARREISPVPGFARVPMLGLFHTYRDPLKGLLDTILEMEGQGGLLSISLGHGFPWSDFADAGACVLAYTDQNSEQAQTIATQLAHDFFDMRETAQAPHSGINETIDQAISIIKQPGSGAVVIADASDNPGGGAASDSTYLIQALMERGIEDVAVALLWDPLAVETAHKAGVGARLPLRIGGKMGPFSGPPLDVDAEILALSTTASQPYLGGQGHVALGHTAVISCNGVKVVMNNIRQQPFHPDCFQTAGVDPAGERILVVKSTNHFRAEFASVAREIIYCDAPGSLNSDVTERPYKKLGRPIWPLDPVDL